MAVQDFARISNLSTQAVACLEKYQATKQETDRIQALEQVSKLARSLELPGDAIYKLFLMPTVLMAVKTASDLGIFTLLSQITSSITCQQLAAPKHADPRLVERIMRVLACNGFADEYGPGRYGPTNLSKQMTERPTVGTVESLFVEFIPIFHKTPEFLQHTDYKNPEDPYNGPFQYAYQTTGSCWDWLGKNPEALDRFNTFMEGSRANTAHWADWFPVQERLLDGVVAESPLLVDVGGGRGHELVGFKEKFPSATGQLVLEDLPSVLDDIRSLNGDIQKVNHDFFKPQPIKGARAYYFKHIMHDWSDENCRKILGHTVAAMRRGYSKILIEDHIVPDQNASAQESMLDLAVMAFCPGAERTRGQWIELLDSVGLVVNNFWLPDGHSQGIIEAGLPVQSSTAPQNVTAA